MPPAITAQFPKERFVTHAFKARRIDSIDLIRGAVMIIMALDHVRDYFHYDAFMYDPTDLTHTNGFLFFTRWITHYCAPVFVFLAGISAYLYGAKKTRKELAAYLLSRGLWMILVELFIISLGRTFNPAYPFFNLQVIWAIGISMITLSGLIYLKRPAILTIAILLIAGHNLLDGVHVPGNGLGAFLWAVLHEPHLFIFGHFKVNVLFPVIPWIGIMALGYYLGFLFSSHYNRDRRINVLFFLGFSATSLFFFLRLYNIYGDASLWSAQRTVSFSLISLLNVTKYPPSLLYSLMTLGPAMIFMALAEAPLNFITEKMVVFGRVPFFYYVLHIYLIHLLAVIAASMTGYHWSDMILNTRVNQVPGLKGYGFNLLTVYAVWILLILTLYPFCKWYERYKRVHQSGRWWLSYV